MAITVTADAIGHVAMTDHLENPVVRDQVLASYLHRLLPVTVDAGRKSLPAQVLLPARELLRDRFHRRLRHVLPMTTDAAVPADVFSLRHSRPLSCQSIKPQMQSHRQTTVTLYFVNRASGFFLPHGK